MLRAILFDVDGTLVDSNDAHADAWVRAFAEHGVRVDRDHVRRCIGMGGDKLMPEVSGIDESTPRGAAIAKRRTALFQSEFLPLLQPFRDSGRLVAALQARGLRIIAASSAKADELTPLLEIAGARHLMDDETSSDDAEESKPDPHIVAAALQKAGVAADEAIMIGDTPYDVEAAGRCGVPVIGFRCGGWTDPDLHGAVAIYDGPWDLLSHLADSPIAR